MNKLRNIPQLVQECGAWKRSLDFLLQENTFLKTRLAENINDMQPDIESLGEVEQYLQTFIRNDEMISFLRNDVTALYQQLIKDPGGLSPLPPEVWRQQKTLRRDIRAIEIAFNELKFQFNIYLSEISHPRHK